MSLGANLKRLRTEKGLSQLELGIICNMEQSNISHFEAGRRKPSLDTIGKLRKGLKCSFDDLLVDMAGA